MKYRFYFDYDIGKKHIEKHGVAVEEINEFFTEIDIFRNRREDSSYKAIGKLKSGRYLEVIYRKISSDYLFIITAYDIEEFAIIDFIESNLE